MDEKAGQEYKLAEAKMKFQKACQQIILLDQQIRDLEHRYKRAVKNKKNSFRYNLRLKLSAATGVKMMFHNYASSRADEVQKLSRELRLPEEEVDTDDMEEQNTGTDHS